jgi:multiple sugar transport system substrate-binding protein
MKLFNPRTARAAAVAGLLSLALAACSGGEGTGGGSGGKAADPKSPKPKQLRMLYATAEADAEAVQAVLPAFKEKFGFELKMDTSPYAALQPKVFSELAQGSSAYDIIIIDVSWMPSLVTKLEPLSKYILDKDLNNMAKTDFGDFIPKVLYDTSVFNAKSPIKQYPNQDAAPDAKAIVDAGFDIYNLPLQANVLIQSYRKDLFNDPQQKAAFQKQYNRPLAPAKTLEEYREVAKFFTQPDKKLHGTTVMAGVGDWSTDDFKTLLASYGGNGRMIGENLSMDFNSPEGVKALEFYRSLITDGSVPPGSLNASWDEVAASFGAGSTAMSQNYHNAGLNEGVKGEVGYAQVPAGTSQGPHFGTWGLAVNPKGKNKAWAYRAITWLTAAEQQLSMTKDLLHPTRTSVYADVTSQTEDPQLKEFYDVLGASLAVGVGRPRLTNYVEVSQAIAVGVNQAASGKKKPQAALDDVEKNVRRLLKEAGYDPPSS